MNATGPAIKDTPASPLTMRLNFSLVRLIILVAALLVFSLFQGFSPPNVEHTESLADENAIKRAWIISLALFFVGAIAVSVIDHRVGLLDPTNLRLLYVVVGAALMIFSIYWQGSIKKNVPQAPVEEEEVVETSFYQLPIPTFDKRSSALL